MSERVDDGATVWFLQGPDGWCPKCKVGDLATDGRRVWCCRFYSIHGRRYTCDYERPYDASAVGGRGEAAR
ncbi:MAG TPA: hypothetical protein VFS33_10530 [Gemmatimonadales bacterium]|nr:hypothetical protein [Gemmatimonadales bacterium]